MGVYIAEAQRAKQMLQRGRQNKAAQADQDHAAHASELPKQPQLSQQQAEHDSPNQKEQNESNSNSAETPAKQQAQHWQYPEPTNHSGLADMGQQSHRSMDESGRFACYARRQVLSQTEGDEGGQAAASAHAAQHSSNLPSRDELHDAAQEPDDQLGSLSAAWPAAEPSVALPGASPSFPSQLTDVHASRSCSVRDSRMQLQPCTQTDSQPNEQWMSHARQTASVMHGAFQQGYGGAASSTPVDQVNQGKQDIKPLTVAEGSEGSRQLASPNAAKFAFAR